MFDLHVVKPVLVNGRTVTSADGGVKIKNLDQIQFPCDNCHLPHVYHVIIPQGDSVSTEQIHFNAQVFKPLLARYPECAHRLRAFIDMMQPKASEPVQVHEAWTCEKKR